jgi:carboxypeptidase family protein
MYRLSGLMPGKYLVRSVGKSYDEGAYLPTFSRETPEAEQALRYEINLDEQVNQANLRPRPGRLISISGTVSVPVPGLPMTVTLVNDMGRHEQKGFSPMVSFRFVNMPPGEYELFGKASDGTPAGALFGAYRTITAQPGRDVNLSMQLSSVRGVGLQVEGKKGEAVDPSQVQVLARPRDLAGAGETLPLSGSPAMLPPGRWELALAPNSLYSVIGFFGRPYAPDPIGADGWHEILVSTYTGGVRWVIARSPAGVRGTVNSTGSPVAGARVFLEAYGHDPKKRVIEIRAATTDLRGQYHFAGLTPGSYRILATFEYEMPDPAAMEAARAQSVRVEDGQIAQVDLDLYEIR